MTTDAALKEQLRAARRMLAVRQASTDLLKFMQLTMPDPEDIEDATRSRYEITPQARLLCQIMEKVHARKLKRVCISIGPQLGKSQILSRGGPAWMLGRDPRLNIILGTYNQPFANEFGDAVRDIMQSAVYAQVFPNVRLRKGGQAKDLLITEDNGRAAFVGRGGSGTGKPADIFLVDDPLKDAIEAQSDTTRNEVWDWFNKVALTRCHDRSSIVVVHTRWNQDDLIGRLADPDHPERNGRYAGIADRWTYINLPSVIEDPKLAEALGLTLEAPTDPFVQKMFGLRPMSALWPGRKGLEFLAEAKQQDPAGFGALYMGQPSPEDGEYFKSAELTEYNLDELPGELTIYGASDHAVGTKQRNDYTVIGCVGVDAEDTIWVLPDVIWGKLQTDQIVNDLVTQFKARKPEVWWMEHELISRSFGPFLLKRMAEERVYTPIEPVVVSKDKLSRARAIQGRVQMRRVRFPRFAPWWPAAKRQMLMFPNGANDDFVDWLAHIGMGLLKLVAPDENTVQNVNGPPSGSIEWILRRTALRMQTQQSEQQAVGW